LVDSALDELSLHGKTVFQHYVRVLAASSPFSLEFFSYDYFWNRQHSNPSLPVLSYEEVFETFGDDGFAAVCDVVPAQADECENELDKPNTVVGEPQLSREQHELMVFEDYVRQDKGTTASTLFPPLDDGFKWDAMYTRQLERVWKVDKIVLNPADNQGAPIARYAIQNSLTNRTYVKNRINNAQFIRFDLEINVRIVATKFHYGCLMLVWRPNFLGGLVANDLTSDTYAIPPTLTCGPYDHVTTASQSEHILLSITGNTSAVMHVPWFMPYQYIPTEKTTMPRFNLGVLDVYTLTPISPADVDPAEMIIYAGFRNVHLYGFMPRKTLPDGIVTVPVGTLPPPVPDKWVMDRVLVGVPAQSSEELQKQQSTASSWVTWFGTIVKTVASIISPFGSFLGLFGFSRPIQPSGPKMVIQCSTVWVRSKYLPFRCRLLFPQEMSFNGSLRTRWKH